MLLNNQTDSLRRALPKENLFNSLRLKKPLRAAWNFSHASFFQTKVLFKQLDSIVPIHIAKLIGISYLLSTSSAVTVCNVSGRNIAGTTCENLILIHRCLRILCRDWTPETLYAGKRTSEEHTIRGVLLYAVKLNVCTNSTGRTFDCTVSFTKACVEEKLPLGY